MKKFIFVVSIIYGCTGFTLLILNSTISIDSCNQIMIDLSHIGSFLSGIGAIVVSIAALIGVNSWVKQLKHGKYLTIVWDAKVILRKLFSLEMSWYIDKYQLRRQDNSERESQLNKNIEVYETSLTSAFQELENMANQIDQIIVNNDFLWANNQSFLKISWLKIKKYLETRSQEQERADGMKLSKLNTNFNENYDFLNSELQKLENLYSK